MLREAEFFLLDSFDTGMRAWDFMRTHEEGLWRASESWTVAWVYRQHSWTAYDLHAILILIDTTKFFLYFILYKFTEKTADPKGASGSAYAFNKPKNQAIKISNTSFILQFASARFVNNFLSGYVSEKYVHQNNHLSS